MIGSRFGRFRITAKLGEGGMGSVWRAEDELLGRAVALKLPALHSDDAGRGRERFLREARAASRLEHPNIASVHDAGDANGQMWIAYQLIEGEPLAGALRDGPLPVPTLLRLARGTASALAHAHERQVLHRDLSAQNVLLRPDGMPVIVDFGLARVVSEVPLTTTGVTLGTAAYMPPEQWTAGQLDARSDLWSLGVVLYQAATGRLPFEGTTPESIMYLVLNQEPEPPGKVRPELPAAFSQAILRLLEKDPRDRLASAAQLLARIPEGAAAEALTGTPDAPSAAISRWWHRFIRRRFGPAQIGLAAGALALVALGGLVAWRQFVPRRELVLAVMPLRDSSDDHEDTGFIGEGLGSELTARLGRVGGFRVLPWETSARFADSKLTLTKLAHELGADLLLVGHFEADDSRITVGLELVDGRHGHQRWSQRFVRTRPDLAALQLEIADQLSAELLPRLAPEARRRAMAPAPANPEAYELYLRGVNAQRSLSLGDRELAEPMYRRALELDSTLAEAWIGLGSVLINRHYEGSGAGNAELHQGEACFRHALELDPGSGPALRGLARVLLESERTTEAGFTMLEAEGPKVKDAVQRELLRVWALLGYLPEEAVEACERVQQLDPHNQPASWIRPIVLWWSGRLPEAEEAGRSYLREFGEDADLYAFLGAIYASQGKFKEAETLLRRSLQLFDGNGGAFAGVYLAATLAGQGKREEARRFALDRVEHFEAQLERRPDNLRLRFDVLALMAYTADTTRFDRTWQRCKVDLLADSSESGTEYDYAMWASAQVGELARAREIANTIAPIAWAGVTGMLPQSGWERLFRGGRVNDLMDSREFLLRRTAATRTAAEIRQRFPWLAGVRRLSSNVAAPAPARDAVGG